MGYAVRRYALPGATLFPYAALFRSEDGPQVELVGGEVVEVSPMGSRHGGCITKQIGRAARRGGDCAIVQVQNPIALDDYSEPQPDISILLSRDDKYISETPGPSHVH